MRKLLLVLGLIFGHHSFSQKDGQPLIDSLLTELGKTKKDTVKASLLYDISINYTIINPKKGLQYGQDLLTLSKKVEWKKGITLGYYTIGANYSSNSDFEKALQFYNKALNSTSDKKLLCKIYKEMGVLYTYQNDYTKALDYDFKSLKLYESLDDNKGVAAVLSNIGIVYFDLKNNSKAIEYYKKALAINQKINNKGNMAVNLGNIGHVYNEMNNYEKAIENYKNAVKYNEEIGNKSSVALFVGAISNAYFKKKDYEKAIYYSNQSALLSNDCGDKQIIAFNASLSGDIYLQIAKSKNNDAVLLNKAASNFKTAIAIHSEMESLRELHFDYDLLSQTEELLGNHKQALDHYKTSVKFKDSVFNSDNRETIKNIEDKRTIDLRNKEIQLNKIKLENKEKQKWFLIAGLAFLGIIGGLLFYQSRKRKQTNQKLQLLNSELDEANKAKTRFFSILNHDLRGPVANLVFFLQLQKESPELLDEESILRMQDKTMTGAENLLASMEDILQWSKSQMENFKPLPQQFQIATLFDDTKKHFSSVENIQFQFENPSNLTLVTDENYLKTIVRNLTGNAVKALVNVPHPMIIWKAFQENGNTYLSITDNGKGATDEEFKALYDEKEVSGIKSGLGLHLIRDLAKAIDCQIKVDTKVNEGTTITLKL
ncbi:tetratricopeptide repeat protein [Flavobacterium sp.]|uniref:tetratricopeptide repeat protein n=1 Tax=Flavobacterium sp. TaxID=239 RepID=UPI002B4B8209|nr:tetratricopeptide repeat protein [Flavobacterium sp.]HLP63572.1 tetratricopeptide repeat protein [Flavobacterium sp.]